MKKIWNGLITAFSMYSALPMPMVEWGPDSMKYALCFFPLVGALIGAACWGWGSLCLAWELSPFLYALGMTVLPLLITGGIHLDGFIDTSDGLHSHQEASRKLEIMKDPHIGAFGVIRCAMYLIAVFAFAGAMAETPKSAALYFLGFMTARGFSAFAMVTFPSAKKDGMARTFADAASKKTVRVCGVCFAVLGFALMVLADFWVGLAAVLASILVYIWFYLFCKKEFGGLTGDLAGYLVSLLELLFLAAAVVGGILA